MARYVALLRGVNVGGNALLKMTELAACVASLGHDAVRTYIASGNVLFETATRDVPKLERALERAIERRFELPVKLTVRDAKQMAAVVARIPRAWRGDAEMRVSVGFLLGGLDARAAAKELSPREGIDELTTAPGALLWATRREALTRTGLKIVGTPLYKQVTVRGLGTTLKLAELVKG